MRNLVRLSHRAEKFLAKLADAALYRRLRAVIDTLEQEARPAGCVGEYRIIYQVKDTELVVLVLSVGHGREVYRR